MLNVNRVVFVGVLLGLGLAIAIGSVRGDPPRRLTATLATSARNAVSPSELAGWIIEGRRDFAVVDMRGADPYKAGHIRDAVHCGTCHQNKAEGRKADFLDLSKKVVLYAQADEPIVLPKILSDNPHVMRLSGGYDAWSKEILAPVSFDGLKSQEDVYAARKREAVRAFFSGEIPTTPAPAPVTAEPVRRSGPHKAAGASEGC
jgi:rhodanese-related sulfurtransferase